MNLVDELLKADAKKADELVEKTLKSEKLGKILGKDKAVEITIREIPAKRLNDILTHQIGKNGKLDTSKVFDAKALAVAEGVINPDMRSQELREHFGCATPKDLAIKLFGNEITKISDEIVGLGNLVDEDNEEEIKN